MAVAEPARSVAGPQLPVPRVPGATYRLQFHAGFTFQDARRLVPYLFALGITEMYASPYLKARSGSAHGYDVADPNSLNPELGDQDDYDALHAELERHSMGQLLDVVPNHMGIGDTGNTWWFDVLENGPSSPFARFFDIDWQPLLPDLQDRNKVILPMLGDQYGRVLERGELRLSYSDGAFSLHYYEHTLPLAPESGLHILEPCVEPLRTELGAEHELVLELQSILTALRHLPPRHSQDPQATEERSREKEVVKRRIARLEQESPAFATGLEATLQALNGSSDDPRSFDRLDALISEQAYRLAYWRVASEEVNYRRFFDVTELAAIRMEDPRVFEQTHRLLLDLVGQRRVTGLRIDHPDGLRDPNGYFWRLQQHCFARLASEQVHVLGDGDAEEHAGEVERELLAQFDRLRARDPASPLARPMYVVVEKILAPDEELRAEWPVHGTTGYEFLNLLNGIFVDTENRGALDGIYQRFVHGSVRFPDLANSTKKMIMLISLGAEVNQLAYLLRRIASRNRRYRDFTLNSLTFAIREVIASLSVYRTYIDPDSGAMTPTDQAYVEQAVEDAKRRNPRTDPSLFHFVRDTLLLRIEGDGSDEERDQRFAFIARFQQVSGPVMAKGVEDTAFYRYNRLVSLNEVGGNPDQFGISLTAFHRRNAQRLQQCPDAMLATSTHDTKRSEDVRARINVLSELPRDWRSALTRWSRLNGRHKAQVDGRAAPDRNEEYLLYQVLLGVWPFEEPRGEHATELAERIGAYMLKALKEAKVNTSWINPNTEYEQAVQGFVQSILDRRESAAFLEDFQDFARSVAQFGVFNSLSQILLKLTVPGVPDVYQGNELWDFSLVDPDNRRAVDYSARIKLLTALQRRIDRGEAELSRLAAELLEHREDGRIKLYVTRQALALRRTYPEVFRRGTYLPLRASGDQKRHVAAFARVEGRAGIVVVAPVLVAGLTGAVLVPPTGDAVWGDTWLPIPGAPGDRYRNWLSGDTVELASGGGKERPGAPMRDLLRVFPVALLDRLDDA